MNQPHQPIADGILMLRDANPPGFDVRDLHSNEGRQVAADWWEENGDLHKAAILRHGNMLEPHFPIAIICRAVSTVRDR